MIKLTAIYIDESGTTVATDHYRPNEERYEPALKLPTTPSLFVCLRCGGMFSMCPGEAVCPRCGHLYCRAADAG